MPPGRRQEQVTRFDLIGGRTEVSPTVRITPGERDLTDHRTLEFHGEEARTLPGCLRDHLLKMITRLWAAKVGVHVPRGVQLDDNRAITGLGWT